MAGSLAACFSLSHAQSPDCTSSAFSGTGQSELKSCLRCDLGLYSQAWPEYVLRMHALGYRPIGLPAPGTPRTSSPFMHGGRLT